MPNYGEFGFAIKRLTKRGVRSKQKHEVHVVIAMTSRRQTSLTVVFQAGDIQTCYELQGLLPSDWALIAAANPKTGLVKNQTVRHDRLAEAVAITIQPHVRVSIIGDPVTGLINIKLTIKSLDFYASRLTPPECLAVRTSKHRGRSTISPASKAELDKLLSSDAVH